LWSQADGGRKVAEGGKVKQALLEMIGERAGHHTMSAGGSTPPTDPRERQLFGLLEILNFGCIESGCIVGISEKQIKRYLLAHKAEVLKLPEPPTYMGLLCGTFNFLVGKGAK